MKQGPVSNKGRKEGGGGGNESVFKKNQSIDWLYFQPKMPSRSSPNPCNPETKQSEETSQSDLMQSSKVFSKPGWMS